MTLAAKPILVEEGEWLAHQGLFNSNTDLQSLLSSKNNSR